MARKQRKQGVAQGVVSTGPCQQIERLIDKRRIKDAFKQAKVCYRQNASPENRSLLERTYLLRIEELARGGMPNAAAEVAKQFIEFGISEQSALAELVLLLPQIGMGNEAISMGSRLDSPEAQATLSVKLADCAVIRPDRTPLSMPDLRAGADRIRAALAALDAGQESRASELLDVIPRSSPWADWRYFVRGLSAFRRGETEQAGANWDRLDAERPASRIARSLRNTAPAVAGRSDDRVDVSVLEMAIFGEPVLARLERLRQSIDPTDAKHFDWRQALGMLGPLRQSLRRIDPRLVQRLTEILLEPLFNEATSQPYEVARRLVDDFTRAAEPLSWDPKWNRHWGLLWEQSPDTIWDAVDHWERYVTDLQTAVAHDAGERVRIQAAVWRHIGEILAVEADARPASPFGFSSPGKDLKKTRARARIALEHSLQLDLAQRATHALLVELHEKWQQPDEMAAAARRLLEAFPNDLETLNRLVRHHVGREEPEEVLSFVQRIRTLKPLSMEYAGHENWAYLARARRHALAGRWEDGRADFSRAAVVSSHQAKDFRTFARQAAFEFKAGEPQRAEEHIREAGKLLAEPTALALSLSIEAARYQLPAGLTQRFQQDLRAALKKKVTGETAGELSKTLLAFQLSATSYAGQDEHIRDVVEYLRRTARIGYREQDLENVCGFLLTVPHETLLLEKLARRGLKSFPKSAVFPSIMADREFAKGPFEFNLVQTRQYLERAVANAEARDVLGENVPDLRRRLSTLKDMEEMMSRMTPRFGKRGPTSLADVFGMLGSMVGDDGEDEYEDEYGEFSDELEDVFFSGPAKGNRKRS